MRIMKHWYSSGAYKKRMPKNSIRNIQQQYITSFDGDFDGVFVGKNDGILDGPEVMGCLEGESDGDIVGTLDGARLGLAVGYRERDKR